LPTADNALARGVYDNADATMCNDKNPGDDIKFNKNNHLKSIPGLAKALQTSDNARAVALVRRKPCRG
jgi:hypothetical protein